MKNIRSGSKLCHVMWILDHQLSNVYKSIRYSISTKFTQRTPKCIYRQLEDDMKTLEGQINSVSKSFSMDHSPGKSTQAK